MYPERWRGWGGSAKEFRDVGRVKPEGAGSSPAMGKILEDDNIRGLIPVNRRDNRHFHKITLRYENLLATGSFGVVPIENILKSNVSGWI